MQVYPVMSKGVIPLVKMILFGLGGSGKTTLAYSFNDEPSTSPVLGVNYGGNPDKLMTGDNPPFIVDCDAPGDIDRVYQFIITGQKADDPFRSMMGLAPDIVFRTVVFDTVSDWQRMRIEQLVGPDREDIISQSKAPEATKHGAPIQASTLRMARKLIVDLPVNVIMTFQQQTVINFTNGDVFTRPFLYGNSRDYVTAWAKLVGRMERGKDGIPVVHWAEAAIASVTKNQIADTLGKGMKDPSAKLIMQKVREFYA